MFYSYIIGDSRTNMRKETVSMIRKTGLFPFVVPMSAADGDDSGTDSGAQSFSQADLETLLNSMDDKGTDTGGTDNNSDTGGTDNTDQQNNNNQDQQQQQNNTQQNQQHSDSDKRNFAFGQMRTQINDLKEMLGKVAKAGGIEYKDTTELMQKLNDDAITKIAQRQNVPVDILKQLEALQKDNQEYKAHRLQEQAAVGFQTVMDKYQLKQEDLQKFAVELDQKGKNPFAQDIDLIAEYQALHYEDILQQEVAKAVQLALTKNNAADQNSSTPNQQQGSSGGGTQTPINTVAGLTTLLDSVK